MILTDSGHVYTVQASTINSYIVRLVYGISRRNHSVSRDMEELPIPCSTDEERVTMNGRPVDGSAVLQGNYLVNCNVHQTIHSYPHSDSGSLTTERSVRSDHSTADFGEAEDTTRQQQTSYVTPQNPTGKHCIQWCKPSLIWLYFWVLASSRVLLLTSTHIHWLTFERNVYILLFHKHCGDDRERTRVLTKSKSILLC